MNETDEKEFPFAGTPARRAVGASGNGEAPDAAD